MIEKSTRLLDYNLLTLKKNNKEKIYVSDIKFTLKNLGINIKGLKKNKLLELLETYYDTKNHYNKNIDKIIKIQKIYKNKLKNKYDNFYSQFTNTEDFYTLDSIRKIDKVYLFWFSENNFKFVFDIRTFKHLLINNCSNPYTRKKIPVCALDKYNRQIELMKQNNIKLDVNEDLLTEDQKHNLKIIRIFQKLDELNIVAEGIDTTYFKNFTFKQLQHLYRVMEDIWNYRAELTFEKKNRIVPFNNVLTHKISYIFNLKPINYKFLQNIILGEIDTLISSSSYLEDRKSGGYYVLIAFTEVSPEYTQEYPWLKQY